ncbi:SDR family oxidoreductase [Kribbella turkmenica]|uniref:SDR family oxidoreductase n=1 Tax=Kribbella turkmenica TaxID=2530375 RepID=A0A4R4XI92_9ACTN|nr:SDR family oxidoreductase [Kribbella turkmenica]
MLEMWVSTVPSGNDRLVRDLAVAEPGDLGRYGAGRRRSAPGIRRTGPADMSLVGLMQAVALDYDPQGIRVNAVLPGLIATEMVRRLSGTVGVPDALHNAGLAATARFRALAGRPDRPGRDRRTRPRRRLRPLSLDRLRTVIDGGASAHSTPSRERPGGGNQVLLRRLPAWTGGPCLGGLRGPERTGGDVFLGQSSEGTEHRVAQDSGHDDGSGSVVEAFPGQHEVHLGLGEFVRGRCVPVEQPEQVVVSESVEGLDRCGEDRSGGVVVVHSPAELVEQVPYPRDGV